MSTDKLTKTVFRVLMPWNDQKEERWLAEQERSGWHLKCVRPFGYTLERGAPAEVAYRLDYQPLARRNREEYLALFFDAGWEHVSTRGEWHLFRKGIVDGQVPEIYTDPQSRIAMYRRVIGFSAVMLAAMAANVTRDLTAYAQATSALSRFDFVLITVMVVCVAGLTYDIVRLLLVISRLKKAKPLSD